MRIAIIGGGIFGVTTAFILARQHSVDLFEKNSDILMEASDVNQCRVHRGYHYPRSDETVKSLLDSLSLFKQEFESAIIHDNDHYYGIAKKDSITSASQYIDFCKRNNLEYKINELDIVDSNKIDLCVKVDENLFDHEKIKKICHEKLKKENVNVFLNHNVDEGIFSKYDYIVICTYGNSNELLKNKKDKQLDFQFELCEKVFVKLPSKFSKKSILILDGPFMSVEPVGSTDYFIIGDVINTIHETSFGKYPKFDEKFNSLLNKGIIKNPSITNYDKFIQSASQFFPDIKNAEYVGSSFCIKTVFSNMDKTDARPTLVRKIDDKILSVFSGKIPTCVKAANEVLEIINN